MYVSYFSVNIPKNISLKIGKATWLEVERTTVVFWREKYSEGIKVNGVNVFYEVGSDTDPQKSLFSHMISVGS